MKLNEEQQKEYDLHQLWLNNEDGGKKLNWSGKNLSYADLSGVGLSCADLSHANLSGADLSNADLSRADLEDADVSHADLQRTDLERADLSGTNLFRTNLFNTDFTNTNLDHNYLHLNCRTLKTKWDDKHRIQFIYHAVKPHPDLVKDPDLIKLMKSELFQKVVNKFHRVEKCGKFEF